MTQAVPIKLHVGNALRLMGQLYRSPAEAMKEYVSNAIDRWRELKSLRRAPPQCRVDVEIRKGVVSINCNTAGMSEHEFRTALGRVADSKKKRSEVTQIGRLGIGLWGFLQMGTACTIFSRDDGDTLRVRLRDGQDHGEFDRAPKHDALDGPGFRVSISGLRFDPTRARGPLASDKLQKLLAEKFDKSLRDGSLEMTLRYPKTAAIAVRAPEITLPRVGTAYRDWWLPGKRPREVHVELFFDPTGKGRVAIAHAGVVVVEKLADVNAYGIESSIFGSGFVTGTVEADFLSPLPARTMFEENDDWFDVMSELDRLRPSIEAEIDALRRDDDVRQLAQVHQTALKLARDILDMPDFRDLALPGGLAKRAKNKPPAEAPRGTPKDGAPEPSEKPAPTNPTQDPPRDPGDVRDPGGARINLVEIPFEDGESRHSRFVGGVVQVNSLNPDYVQEMAGSEDRRIGYVTMLIGKEVLAYNGGDERDDVLDRYLGFLFEMKRRAASPLATPRKRRPRAAR